MIKLSLNGAWEMHPAGSDKWFPATVPGSVYSDLLSAGKMEDPYWRDNERKATVLMEQDYIYERDFFAERDLSACEQVLLRCEGLDTLAEVYLNGRLAGYADNMHRIWEFDVKELLLEGRNHFSICFRSPNQAVRTAYEKSRADGIAEAMKGFPHIRKAHYMYGWDWGPRLPDAGIWRDISLLGISQGRIEEVQLHQIHQNGQVSLTIHTAVKGCGSIRIEIACPDGQVLYASGTDACLTIKSPQLWWPRGLGSQPLYRVTVTLSDGERLLDQWSKRIGLREVSLCRKKDRWGESFAHAINGVAFFALGVNYIPEDNLLSRVTPERTRRLLEDAAAANFNLIRVWGGGYYPDDSFFDVCDELGLVVWQDLMFSCAVYDLTEAFEETVCREIADNVRRIRHHACLCLWCGNNEMEMFMDTGKYFQSYSQKADYTKMYEYIFPKLLNELDPDTPYWPSSPSSGGGFDFPNDPTRGDVHYWEVWHGGLPFTDYRNHFFRYVSEFGFQSFPCLETIESFTEPEDRNIFSYVMEKHQRNAAANGKILQYLAQLYRYPATLEGIVYASQLLQAQAMQYGVEHWRRNRDGGRCMGAVIWQLNDCWPVASWSSIDYFGRWKALHYYAKRFQSPVLLSCLEEGSLLEYPDVNAEAPLPIPAAQLNVSNETQNAFSGRVTWRLRQAADGAVLQSATVSVQVPPLSALWLERIEFPDMDIRAQYLEYVLEQDGTEISSGTTLFCPPKYFAFADPALSVLVCGDVITVRAQSYARSVEIRSEDPNAVFSDNYFDMSPGERSITLLRGTASRLSVRSVFDIR